MTDHLRRMEGVKSTVFPQAGVPEVDKAKVALFRTLDFDVSSDCA